MNKLIIGIIDLLTISGDWQKALELCMTNGAAGFRFMLSYNWGFENPLQPFKKFRTWTAGNSGLFPFYDLTQRNPEYWEKLERILRKIKSLGATAYPVLYDFCSWDHNSALKFFNPFESNLQLVGDPGPDGWGTSSNAIPGGIWGISANGEFMRERESLRRFHRWSYILPIVNLLNDVGVDYRIETINELALSFNLLPRFGSFVKLHEWIVQVLEGYGVPKSKMIVSTFGDFIRPSTDHIVGGAFSMHNICDVRDINNRLGEMGKRAPGVNLIFSSDGAWWGEGKSSPNCPDIKAPSIEQAKGVAEKAIEMGSDVDNQVHETCGGPGCFGNADWINYDIIHAFGETFGTIPVPPEPPEPPPPPIPPVPPEPPKPKSCWQKLIHWLFGKNSCWGKIFR